MEAGRPSSTTKAWFNPIAILVFCSISFVGCSSENHLLPVEKQTIRLFANASPSVVSITPLALSRNTMDMSAFPQGQGSGFIWNENGFIVTNMHVIAGADALQVTLHDQTTWPARVVGVTPEIDLAVLHIQAPKQALTAVKLGESGRLQVGQRVLAIGNPYGLDHSLTVGVVSALDRRIESLTGRDIRGVIQTDASINPGNSGGPLLDSLGRLIGVNTAIRSPSGGSAGVGFAVPVDTVRRVVPQLIRHGRLIRPRLGVHLASRQITRRLGVQGLLILTVDPRSAAGRSGLRGTGRDRTGRLILGDIIISVDGVSVPTSDALMERLELVSPNGKIRLQYRRGSALLTTEVAFVKGG